MNWNPHFRPFRHDNEVRFIGMGLLQRCLPQPAWTHAAHLAAGVYLLRERQDIDLRAQLPGIIQRYNLSVGTPNSDTEGYHHSITLLYIAAVEARVRRIKGNASLAETANAIINSPLGSSDFPLRFYSRGRLFSVKARHHWVEPDVTPLSLVPEMVGE